ncbi:MAG: fused MFS/spermidine synthase [Deltaproteobacteria bacterium]|nr:MAG: fused MFS/spermidine synthase [Deltaproteobacteria bacterium]
MKATSSLAFALIGVAATVGQILALRELLSVFAGCELAVAVVLAAWLFWTALGSLLGGIVSGRTRNHQNQFCYLQGFSGLTLIGTIFLIRAARSLFEIGAGELVTFGQMVSISFLTLAPFCLLSGFLFSLACTVLAVQIARWTKSPGLVYFLEGLGAGIGGLLFTIILIHHFHAVEIAIGIAFLLGVSGLVMAWQTDRSRLVSACVFAMILLSLAFLQYKSTELDMASRKWQWSGFRLVDSQETIYGHIVVVAKEDQLSFFESGLWNFTVPDRLSAEEAVHYAVLQHPEPQEILLIGGGVSGSLAQLLKHPSVRLVEYVELDPKLISLGKRLLPAEVTVALEDPRVVVHHEDGRRYLSLTANLYDVILVNLPDPFTMQVNRFYTLEFFRLAASKMRDTGVFFFSARAAETALGPIQAKYLKLLHSTALRVFPEVVLFPGQTARFFCAKSPGILTTQPETLLRRLRQRGLRLLYVQDHYLLWDLSPLRQETFLAMVDQAEETGVNRDLNPRAYSYNLLLWGSQYSSWIGKVFSALSKRTVWISAILWCLFVFLVGFRRRFVSGDAKPIRMRLLYAVAIFGLTGIALEILIVLSFQVFFGYVYYKIGLLLALFMVGLAMGSMTLSYYPKRRAIQINTFIAIQFIVACFCLGLTVLIVYLQSQTVLSDHPFLHPEVFSFLSLAAGFLGGTHFPLANRILLRDQAKVGSTAGLIYGVDLLGSFVGCLLVGLILIPLTGIVQTLILLALVNLTATVPLLGKMQSAGIMVSGEQ